MYEETCDIIDRLTQERDDARKWAEDGSALLALTGYKLRLPWPCTNPDAHSEMDMETKTD